MERWEEGFYITAMAGASNGASLVVMSKGTPYTQQSYKVSALPASANACLFLRESAKMITIEDHHLSLYLLP